MYSFDQIFITACLSAVQSRLVWPRGEFHSTSVCSVDEFGPLLFVASAAVDVWAVSYALTDFVELILDYGHLVKSVCEVLVFLPALAVQHVVLEHENEVEDDRKDGQ